MIICTQVHKCFQKFIAFTKKDKPSKSNNFESKEIHLGKETFHSKKRHRQKTSIFGDDATYTPAPKQYKTRNIKQTAFVKPTTSEKNELAVDEPANVIQNQWNNKGTSVYSTKERHSYQNQPSLKYVIFIPTEQKDKTNHTSEKGTKELDDKSIITLLSNNSKNSGMSAVKSNQTTETEVTSKDSKKTHSSDVSAVKFDPSKDKGMETQSSESSEVTSNESKIKESTSSTDFRASDKSDISQTRKAK